ncbi:MAG TPA: tripartite tricarboxylate transporter TctB family protein, partial [Hyphomicrobiaceae bacterium]|nr:tripartite tricarboxylate transporter TctB family protein [Hyphomicrobiaceae bacterium]
ARMGPGYFPMLISASLVLVGVVLVGRALLSAGDALGAIRWRPLVLILAGVLSFGFLIDRAGLLAAGILLIVASRLADRELRPIETVLLAIGLTLATGAVFLYGLGLPIKWLRV